MRYLIHFIVLLSTPLYWAQSFSGQVFMRDNADVYFNTVYITNLRTFKTVLSNSSGNFSITAQKGDKIRFTSRLAQRQDLTIGERELKNENNFIELKPYYHSIEEVVLGWNPTGNLKTDVIQLTSKNKKIEIAQIVGLPTPIKREEDYLEPLVGLANGGLGVSVQGIYNLISGEHKKIQRLQRYERMQKNVTAIRNYYGDDYFVKVKIPVSMINNFIQFVYSSDQLGHVVELGELEAVRPSIEKYLPIYQKRLRDSSLSEIQEDPSS